MPKSLRSILGSGNRVRKPTRPSGGGGPPRPTAAPAPLSSSPRRKRPSQPRKRKEESDDQDATELFPDRLEDAGLAGSLLAEELTLRDAVQAMRYIRSHMFTPLPETGFHSTRRTELLNYRATMPPVVTSGHLLAVLARTSPTRVEREVAELLGKGVLRRVRVERRRGGGGGAGEALIETSLLMGMLAGSTTVSLAARDAYAGFLRANPTAQRLGGHMLSHAQTDELVRAGFLTSAATSATLGTTTLHVRPEDRTTLTSIQRVSQLASGTVAAVGGHNAVHMAGGSGMANSTATNMATGHRGGGGVEASGGGDYRVAVPGHGRHLKLAEQAMDWLREALGRTKWGEAPEDWLRERFEGGGLHHGPRWKEFHGVEWTWVLGEAVGLGVVEVFQTGAVGRGVRALGG